MTETDVLILGAGAAGLMCAIAAGRRARRVLVLEHGDRPGKKILISGGGRCNFTNIHADAENYISANPHFARSALARYTPQDFLALVGSHNIPWHEKTLGQLFCDRSAHDILNLLLAECAAAKVRIQLSQRVISIAQTSTPSARFRVETSSGPVLAHSVVIATGGLSIPKMGATSFGYDIARQFQHPVVEPRPALVPFTLSGPDRDIWCDLTGVSTEVLASVERPGRATVKPPSFREKLLITHRGLSGPAALQISSYWSAGQAITLDLAPDQQVFTPMLEPGARRSLASAIEAARSKIPARLAERWVSKNVSSQGNILSNAAIEDLERKLHTWRLIPAGTEGYGKAEVTAGGVSTDALDPRTLESHLISGLYFIGEVVDVTGWLGGYNFQWAWASGNAAGVSA